MNQWWCGRLPQPPSCLTPSTFQTTHQCRQVTQRYAYPVLPEDPTVLSLINPAVQYATPSARSPADPPTNAFATKRLKPPSPSMFPWEMRPSTTWGQYIHTQGALGGQLLDPAYPASSGRMRACMSQAKTVVTKKRRTMKIPTPYQQWDVQLARLQALVEDRQRLTQSKVHELTAPCHPFCQASCWALNIHPNYIPFKLTDDKTSRDIPAKYIQLFLNNDNPYAYAKMSTSGLTFIGKIHVAPDTDMWMKPNYTNDNMQYFGGKYHNRAKVDTAVARLCDPSLQAKIQRHWGASYHHWMLTWQIDWLEGELYAVGMQKCASMRRLMAAIAKAWIEAKQDEEGFVRVVLPWEHVCNTLHIDDLDNGLWTWTFDLEKGVVLQYHADKKWTVTWSRWLIHDVRLHIHNDKLDDWLQILIVVVLGSYQVLVHWLWVVAELLYYLRCSRTAARL